MVFFICSAPLFEAYLNWALYFCNVHVSHGVLWIDSISIVRGHMKDVANFNRNFFQQFVVFQMRKLFQSVWKKNNKNSHTILLFSVAQNISAINEGRNEI